MQIKEIVPVSDFYSGNKIDRAQGKIYYPQNITATHGNIQNADALLNGDATYATLFSDQNTKPYILIDMGKSSLGGYVAFKVTGISKNAQLRLAFSNLYDNIVDETFGERGDYLRGTCQYLGVELPILPADPHRFELFHISEPGEYFFPLLQGQFRWIRLQLDTADTKLQISELRVENHGNFDTSAPIGYFHSDIPAYNKVWHAGVWTAQLASIPNNHAWEKVCGYILPRYIETADPIGFIEDVDSRCYHFSFTARISLNPSHTSSMGFAVDVTGKSEGLVGKLSLGGTLELFRVRGAERVSVFRNDTLPLKIVDNTDYRMDISVKNTLVQVQLNGIHIAAYKDSRMSGGSVGFYSEKEMWYAVKDISLDGRSLDNLDLWNFKRTQGYLSDGATRDRLLWTGDIGFASRNIYYALDPKYIRSSLYMMMQNQTDEGYVNPSPYPANDRIPSTDDYGPFPSAEFSAWFTPIVAEYVAFTGDRTVAADTFCAVEKNLQFITRDIDPEDGLFRIVPALSKTVFVLSLGEGGKCAYTNVLVYLAFQSGAYLAKFLGEEPQAEAWNKRAQALKHAILTHLFDRKRNTLIDRIGNSDSAEFANALGILCGLFDAETADKLPLDCEGPGKLLGLSIRAMLERNEDATAFKRIRKGSVNVNWIDAQNDWRHPATVSECMHYPESGPSGQNWNDKSHPDAAISDIFTSYLLGVKIADTAFDKITVKPHFLDANWVCGIVPTPHGEVRFGWELTYQESCRWHGSLSICAGITADLSVPITGSELKIKLNGQALDLGTLETTDGYLSVKALPAGEYEISVVSNGDVYRRYIQTMTDAVSDREETGWLHYRIVGRSGEVGNDVLWVCPPNHESWIELELLSEKTVSELNLEFDIREDDKLQMLQVAVANESKTKLETIELKDIRLEKNKPTKIELFTVLGSIKGRFVKLTTSGSRHNTILFRNIHIR